MKMATNSNQNGHGYAIAAALMVASAVLSAFFGILPTLSLPNVHPQRQICVNRYSKPVFGRIQFCCVWVGFVCGDAAPAA